MTAAKTEIPAWIKLDNAANIYPPSRTRGWTPMFRLSATLNEPIDPPSLEKAQAAVLKRLPTFAQRLRKGLFWYYFEKLAGAPDLQRDVGNPMVRMNLNENGRFLFRVRWYKNRIAVEFFHVLTDGTGGMCFLLTLVAEYLRVRYKVRIKPHGLVLDCRDKPLDDEARDWFGIFARDAYSSRREVAAYHIQGRPEQKYFLNITTGIIKKDDIKAKAREYGASVTAFLAAVLIDCCQAIQFADPRVRARKKPVKVSIPVNLRRFYGVKTVRNFASYVNVGVNSASGRFSFDEIITAVIHTMGLEITEEGLNGRISANVKAERNPFIRAMPLFIKSPMMRLIFMLQGDRYNSVTLSNLGEVNLPEAMIPYVERMDFLLGVPAQNPVVCACVTCKGNMYLNFSRKTREPILEQAFFTSLVKMGVHVKIESNRR